ncbi:hypothetical protein C8R44DRAFT_990670 [Mycena epipterygia]|nr:hypothetical protein C8R44DRAFT_990670 [Mycena epipterygia]
MPAPLCALQIRALRSSPRTSALPRRPHSHPALTPGPNSRPAPACPRNTRLASRCCGTSCTYWHSPCASPRHFRHFVTSRSVVNLRNFDGNV